VPESVPFLGSWGCLVFNSQNLELVVFSFLGLSQDAILLIPSSLLQVLW